MIRPREAAGGSPHPKAPIWHSVDRFGRPGVEEAAPLAGLDIANHSLLRAGVTVEETGLAVLPGPFRVGLVGLWASGRAHGHLLWLVTASEEMQRWCRRMRGLRSLPKRVWRESPDQGRLDSTFNILPIPARRETWRT